MNKILVILNYSLEILIALYFLLTGQISFLIIFLFLCAMLYKITKGFDYIRKLVRVYQVANETKLTYIMKKLKITQEEKYEANKEIEAAIPEYARKSFEKDMDDLLKQDYKDPTKAVNELISKDS